MQATIVCIVSPDSTKVFFRLVNKNCLSVVFAFFLLLVLLCTWTRQSQTSAGMLGHSVGGGVWHVPLFLSQIFSAVPWGGCKVKLGHLLGPLPSLWDHQDSWVSGGQEPGLGSLTICEVASLLLYAMVRPWNPSLFLGYCSRRVQVPLTAGPPCRRVPWAWRVLLPATQSPFWPNLGKAPVPSMIYLVHLPYSKHHPASHPS